MKFIINGEERNMSLSHVVNAGYAARNQENVKAHINELKELGVPVPGHVPTFYPVPVLQLTQGGIIEVGHGSTSAEIEYVYIVSEGKSYITVGSDHSDRALEAYSVPAAKQICPNVVANELWEYDSVKGHLEKVILTCHVFDKGEWRLYQKGSVAEILDADKLLSLGAEVIGDAEGLALYSGTIPTIGEITYGDRWKIEMMDETNGKTIGFEYAVKQLPESID